MKSREELPDWLRELLAATGAERGKFSKFEMASEAVHGQRPGALG